MQTNFRILFASLSLLIGFSAGASSGIKTPSRIMIIRHAEKSTDPQSPHLSTKGYARARALTHLFEVHPEYLSKGRPAEIFASKYKPGKNANRAIETITPLANALGLTVQTPYSGSDSDQLAELILEDINLRGQVVLISWVHGSIPKLADAL